MSVLEPWAQRVVDAMNPYAKAQAIGSGQSGAQWGSGLYIDRLPSSSDQLKSETRFQAGVYRPGFLPLFGPQLPSITNGTVTDAIPGAVYDSGVPGNGAFVTQFAGQAARQVNDFMTQPYTYRSSGEQDLPLGAQLKNWWAGLTSKIVNPFVAGPKGNMDNSAPKDTTADAIKFGAIAIAATAAAAVGVAVFSKK